tara:strand:- start:63 stop:584 length:522 start_codon:yes stop_codon:yes gene_type:complete
MNLNLSQFLNIYDLSFLIILFISIFFGIKNGITKSLFNLIKWIFIFYLIKYCFDFLRPVFDQYISNKTISDILIFLFTLITSYILLSFMNRIIIAVLQPKRSGLVDLAFGSFFGLFRGYIVFVLLIFFIDNNLTFGSLENLSASSSLHNIVNYGTIFLEHIPRDLDKLQNLDI